MPKARPRRVEHVLHPVPSRSRSRLGVDRVALVIPRRAISRRAVAVELGKRKAEQLLCPCKALPLLEHSSSRSIRSIRPACCLEFHDPPLDVRFDDALRKVNNSDRPADEHLHPVMFGARKFRRVKFSIAGRAPAEAALSNAKVMAVAVHSTTGLPKR